jgi:hypothetical protein
MMTRAADGDIQSAYAWRLRRPSGSFTDPQPDKPKSRAPEFEHDLTEALDAVRRLLESKV